jgi:hypothetical protein
LQSKEIPRSLGPVKELLESEIIQDFPLDDFGLSLEKLLEVISQYPNRIGAFFNAVKHISRSYQLTHEAFYEAVLRSYRELLNNYLEDIELVVDQMHMEFIELNQIPFSSSIMADILLKFGVRTNYDHLGTIPQLKDIRSIYHPKDRILYVNQALREGQKNLIIGREIAFQWFKMKKRPIVTPHLDGHGFEELLNNHKASYFAASLIMPRELLIEDIKEFYLKQVLDQDFLISLLGKYNASPEMLMQRLISILPNFFNHEKAFFMRFLKSGENYLLTKEFNLSKDLDVFRNELNEHYCRRWSSIQVITALEKDGSKDLNSGFQIVNFINKHESYMIWSLGFRNVSNPDDLISVSVGFLIDEKVKSQIHFIEDKNIPHEEVSETCERCSIENCLLRASGPTTIDHKRRTNQIKEAIEDFTGL